MLPATNSDSEDDFDYVPPPDDESSDDHFELGTLEGSKPLTPLKDSTEQKRHVPPRFRRHVRALTTSPFSARQRDSLWASFRASVTTPPSDASRDGQTARPTETRRVKVEKTYLFAGKHVTEVVEVPEDSEEANKWPRAPTSSELGMVKVEEQGKDGGEGDSPAPSPAATSPAPSTARTSAPGVKRPGPRKPRTALPSIPKASQAKKITTLDKSAMDWRAHVASGSSDVKDELNANRRGGGYLEKMEFLKRVEDRREDALEASKASKRRKT